MEGIYLVYNTSKTVVRRCVDGMRDFSAPLRDRMSHPTTQKRIIMLIVCLALLLDNMLYMVIVPIIDDYFKSDLLPVTTAAPFYEDFTVQTSNFSIDLTLYPSGSGQVYSGSDEKPRKRNIKPLRGDTANFDGMMGLLFASKAIVQLLVNPFTGAFIDRVGYVTPLTMGLLVMFISTSVFAGASSYGWLFLARSLQGLGSALADTAAFGFIADRFQDEAERSKALGIALAFISFGSLVAPPFGGVLYEFAGKQVPFLILAFVCLVDAMLLLLVRMPSEDEEKAREGNMPVSTPIYKLLMDPYIMVIAGSLTIANFPLAFLESTIAKWMDKTMDADPWQIGLVWLPPFIPHVLGVFVTVRLSAKYFRFQWLYGAIGLVLIGVSSSVVASCKTYEVLIIPLSIMCFGIALIDTALLPTLAFLVDVRHTSVYGSVYAIADISYSVAYALGPVLAGQAFRTLGYMEMNVIIGLANMFFAPTLLVLRKVYDWKVERGERAMLLPDVTDTGDSEGRTFQVKRAHMPASLSSIAAALSEDEINKRDSTSSKDSSPTSDNYQPSVPSKNGFVPNVVSSTNSTAAKSKFGQIRDSVKISPRPRPRPRKLHRNSSESIYDSTSLNWKDPSGSNSSRNNLLLSNTASPDDMKSVSSYASNVKLPNSHKTNASSSLFEPHEHGFEVRNPLFNDNPVYFLNEGE